MENANKLSIGAGMQGMAPGKYIQIKTVLDFSPCDIALNL